MDGRRKSLKQTLEEKVDKTSTPDGCWLWTGALRDYHHEGGDRFAYGDIRRDGKHIYAHRIAYELEYGPIGDSKLKVCHHCDNPLCCRPDHLFLGTQEANLKDMAGKGRWGNKTRVDGVETDYVPITGGECSESGCLGKVVAKGLCGKHYQRIWKKKSKGDP